MLPPHFTPQVVVPVTVHFFCLTFYTMWHLTRPHRSARSSLSEPLASTPISAATCAGKGQAHQLNSMMALP